MTIEFAGITFDLTETTAEKVNDFIRAYNLAKESHDCDDWEYVADLADYLISGASNWNEYDLMRMGYVDDLDDEEDYYDLIAV